MSLLQFFVIIIGIVFIIFGIDLYKNKKMNVLHLLVFVLGSAAIITFGINPGLLDKFGKFFGTARGADVLVYTGGVLLFYFYMELVNYQTKDKIQLTRLISQEAINEAYANSKQQIENYKNTSEKDDFIFNIRVYNEGSIVGKTIDEVIAAGFKKILLVNDGSSDNTLEILEQKKAQHPQALIITASHTINRGGGAANQTGYNFVKKYGEKLGIKWFVGFDADGQMDIKDMQKFMQAIKQHKTDIYLGSRFLHGSKAENMPLMRRIILWISRMVTLVLYQSSVSDPHNGYKVIGLEALKKINITADGMHYANEVNEQIKKKKIQYKEIPVHIRYTDYSLGKGQKNSNSIKLAVEMLYKKLFFR